MSYTRPKHCNSYRAPGNARCTLPWDHAERCQFPTRKAVTLFSGLGSSSKALRDLGYDVFPHDLMSEAVETLQANGFHRAVQCNVKDVDFTAPRYADVEVLAGGPPCQPFSQAHKGDGRYDERDMIPEFVRAVAEMLPKVFVMEEVKTLAWAKHADYLAKVEDDLRALGYRVEHRVLDASDYFIPQARKRLFIVGVREDVAQEREISRNIGREGRNVWTVPRDAISWPEKSETKQTLADALGWDLGDAYEAHAKTPNPTGDYGWVWERPGVTVVGSFRADVQAKPGWRKPGDGPRQNTPGSVSLTVEERLVLQDMPRDWIVRGSKAKVDLQVGNSVPCGLIREIIDINIP